MEELQAQMNVIARKYATGTERSSYIGAVVYTRNQSY
jgi:hypothetical protein